MLCLPHHTYGQAVVVEDVEVWANHNQLRLRPAKDDYFLSALFDKVAAGTFFGKKVELSCGYGIGAHTLFRDKAVAQIDAHDSAVGR